MFVDFYNLKQEPFGVTPDPAFLYLGRMHREALASLIYAIQSDRGFAALIAESGMGKTSLLFFLLEKLKDAARTAFLFQTRCEPETFMQELLAELRPGCRETDPVLINERLKECLLHESRAGRRVIVLIDEAQNLSEAVLESVRLLSDFETPRTKLLEIILSGQPELAAKLARPELAQLSQRISTVCKLRKLPQNEVAAYVEHRLRVAGCANPASVFTPEAQSEIARLSEGIPRKINNLCFNALSLGFTVERKPVGPEIVREAANDLALGPQPTSEEVEQAEESQSRPADAACKDLDQWFETLIGRERKTDPVEVEAQPANTPTTMWADTTAQAAAPLASETFSVFEFQRAWPHSVATTRLDGTETVSNTIQSRVRNPEPRMEVQAEEIPRAAAGQPALLLAPEAETNTGANAILENPGPPSPPWPEPVRSDSAVPANSSPPQTNYFTHGRAWLALAGIVLSGLAGTGMYLGYTKAVLPDSKSNQQQQAAKERSAAMPSQAAAPAPAAEQRAVQAPKKKFALAGATADSGNGPLEFSSLHSSERNRRVPRPPLAPNVRVPVSGHQPVGESSQTNSGQLAPSIVPPGDMALFAERANPGLRMPTASVPRLGAETASVIPGKLIKAVQPSYPASARSLGIQGAVVLDALVAEDGRVSSVQVLSGNSLLTGAAMKAVKQWRYKPYMVDGKPSREHTKVRVIFSLDRKR